MSAETTDSGTGERVLAARIARAEALIDAWEHDAPGLVEPVFVGRLREVLRRDPAPVRLRDAATPDADDASEHRPNACCDFHRHIADGCCHCGDDASTEASES